MVPIQFSFYANISHLGFCNFARYDTSYMFLLMLRYVLLLLLLNLLSNLKMASLCESYYDIGYNPEMT